MTDDDAAWLDPDRAVQIEDDNAETLAGDETEFDPEADDLDAQEDFLPTPSSSDAGVENPPAERA